MPRFLHSVSVIKWFCGTNFTYFLGMMTCLIKENKSILVHLLLPFVGNLFNESYKLLHATMIHVDWILVLRSQIGLFNSQDGFPYFDLNALICFYSYVKVFIHSKLLNKLRAQNRGKRNRMFAKRRDVIYSYIRNINFSKKSFVNFTLRQNRHCLVSILGRKS